MCHRAAPAVFLALLTCTTALAQSEISPGFRKSTWPAYLEAENRAAAIPAPEQARSWLRTLTEEPHVAGTPADYDTAVFVRDKLREWGWKADLFEYECLINYPLPESVRLELVRPMPNTLPITEQPLDADKDSASTAAFPAFHGYGASGDVTAQVVYANYGRPEDFETPEKLGVDVRGKIVVVRYGRLFRGLKVLNAQKRGAAGVLIYSDPLDDGYMRGDVYPHGPFRPGSAIQRGSVQFLSQGPGDPSTPGWPSQRNGRRLPFDPLHGFPLDLPAGFAATDPQQHASPRPFRNPREAATPAPGQRAGREAEAVWERQTGLKRREYFAAIPSLPISYDAARPILQALGGPEVPEGWQGGLPFAYHLGAGPAEVRLAITMDYKIRPIWNVIARIDGSVEPERWVMLGNHRDAWTYGAVDPGSGTAATLETCRALGEAVKNGWTPRRTLVYASWDGEEYGLLGSTEWAEEMAESLSRKAVLMLNVDAAVSGRDLSVSGIPSLRDLFLSSAAAVTEPRSGKSLGDIWIASRREEWSKEPFALDDGPWTTDASTPPPGDPTPEFAPRLDPLGSGSDYTAFVDHIGIPALDVDFGGRYGVYHSIYDNFFWMEKFGDPEFLTHATAARLYTRIMMRAAGSEVVPLTFSPYAQFLRREVDDLRSFAARKTRATGKPLAVEGLPAVIASIRKFEKAAAAADLALESARTRDDLAGETLVALNDGLTQVERAFLHPGGLPGRTWFRHQLIAPGLTTGYAAWTLPGLRQALQDGNAAAMMEQSKILATRIDAATAALERIPTLIPTPPAPPAAVTPAPATP